MSSVFAAQKSLFGLVGMTAAALEIDIEAHKKGVDGVGEEVGAEFDGVPRNKEAQGRGKDMVQVYRARMVGREQTDETREHAEGEAEQGEDELDQQVYRT